MTKEEKEIKEEIDKVLTSIYSKINEDEKIFLSYLVDKFNVMCEKNLKAIEYIKTQYNTFPSAEEWRKALLDILEVEDEQEK